MSTIGSVGVRIVPNLAGFGSTVSAAVAGSGSMLARSGAAAGLLISAPIIAGVAVGVGEAVKFESALAGVAKTTDGTKAQIDAIGTSVRDMAKEMPFTRENLLGMAEAVGRFGVSVEDIPQVTEMFAKLGTAIPEMNPEVAAEQMVRFFNIMNTPLPQWEKNLSTVVDLGNNTATSEQQIISFASRLAQIGAFTNATEDDILGLSAAFSAMNIRPDAGASSLTRVFLEMDEAIKGNADNMGVFNSLMGTTNEQFTELYTKDPAQAFVGFINGLKAAEAAGKPITGVLDQLGINDIRVRRTILAAMGNTELLTTSLDLANNAAENNTALQEEFAKRAETTESKWIMLKNRMSDVALTLGDALIPVMLDLMDAVEPVVEFIAMLAEGFLALDEDVRMFIVTAALIVAAIGPMVFIGSRLYAVIMNLRAALALLSASPVMIILMAIALVALLIILHWDTLKRWLSNFWQFLQEGWDGILLFVSDTWDAMGTKWEETWEGIANFFYEKWMMIKGWWDEFIQKIMDIIGWFINLRDNFGKAWDWIVQKAREAKDTLIAIMGEIGAAADRALGPLDEIIGGGINLAVGAYRQVTGKDNGGIVPGPIGAPRMILAHGGEEVIARHKGKGGGLGGNVVVNIANVTMANDMDVVRTSRMLAREAEREMKAAGL